MDENFLTECCKLKFVLKFLKNKVSWSKISRKTVSLPHEVYIYRDPETGEHLGMALVDFKTKLESELFIHIYDQKTIMGSKLTCFFDTFGAQLIYFAITLC